MEETLISNALAYAAQHQLQLAERLGFGVHGIIFAAEAKHAGGLTAVKAHRERDQGMPTFHLSELAMLG